MKKKLDLFMIHKEERWPALVAFLYFASLNGLMVYKYADQFCKGGSVWENIVKSFNISGFDPYVDLIIASWRISYTLFRHPLMSVFLYPLSELNSLLREITHQNCAIYITAVIYTILGFYTFLWLFRIIRHVVGLSKGDTCLLTAMFFSFASIMLTAFVPDHFAITLFFLILTLYLAGTYREEGRRFRSWQLALLFFIPTGVTLTNSIKIFLAWVYTNIRRPILPPWRTTISKIYVCDEALRLIGGFLIPALLMFGIYLYLDEEYYEPQKQMVEVVEKARASRDPAFAKQKQRAKKKEEMRRKKQVVDSPYFQWTDKDLPRLRSVKENLFGESIQLHQDYLLIDVNRGRPVFVEYDYAAQYIVVGLIILLFIAGIVAGIHEPFLWLVLSWFVFDMTIHLGFGFGLSEVSIMGAHWLFAIPIAVGYLMSRLRQKGKWALRTVVGLLSLYLIIYNGWLIVGFLLD